MTLSGKDGESPKRLNETCEVGVAFHSTGYLSVGLCFKNVEVNSIGKVVSFFDSTSAGGR